MALRHIHIAAAVLVSCIAAPTWGQTCTCRATLEPYVIKAGDLSDFTPETPRFYDAALLWNYINGGAAAYQDYGVLGVAAVTGVYEPEEMAVTVDVYDMGTTLGAFGIYSSERDSESASPDIGGGACLTTNTLIFWKNAFYVKVMADEYTPDTTEPLLVIAREIESRIEGESHNPDEFETFPEAGRREGSERYIAKNALGQDYFTNCFAVDYADGEREYTVYLLLYTDEYAAVQALQQYRLFLREYAQLHESAPDVGDEALSGEEGWYGPLVFARTGQYIMGVTGLTDESAASDAIQSLIDAIY